MGARNRSQGSQPQPSNMSAIEQQYYEVNVTAQRCVCVKAENEDDAIQTACDELGMEWNEIEGEIEDEYGDGTDPEHARYIEIYKKNGQYYETVYFDDAE